MFPHDHHLSLRLAHDRHQHLRRHSERTRLRRELRRARTPG